MKSTNPELAFTESQQATEAARAHDMRLANQMPEPSTGQLLQAVIEKGVTSESVGVLERLIALRERQEERQAEKDFAAAFVALQADLPVIVAESVIPNRGKYQRFEDIMRDISGPLAKHGFSVSFSMDSKDGRVTETCHLAHIGGVTKSNSFGVRVGRADSETQADCKAATTAKRLALCNALNIVIRQDSMQDEDAAHVGSPITFEQVETLREMVKETGSDLAKFLAFARAATIEDIGSEDYDRCFRALDSKRRA